MTELKSCPFCGSTKVYCEKEFFANDTIICQDCGLAVFSISYKDVIKKWNRRVNE